MPEPEANKDINRGKDKLTPEEKLLRIIEDPVSGGKRHNFFESYKKKAPDLKVLIAEVKKFRLNRETFKKLNLRIANRIVVGACVCFTLFLIFSFISDNIYYKRSFEKLSSEASGESVINKVFPAIDVTESELVKETGQRNMFSFLPPKAEAAVTTEVPTVITDFKLVGILWSDNPQAMIEDKKDQKTYFLKSGEKIKEIMVKEILRDKVVLGSGDREWELR